MLRVFDSKLWAGKDKGDNSQFWKSARPVRVYRKNGDWLIDVCFYHDGRISKGHFLDMVKLDNGFNLC